MEETTSASSLIEQGAISTPRAGLGVRAGLEARILPGVRAVSRDAWDVLFPTDVEGWDYYVACEASPPPAFAFSAIGVYADGSLVAAAPIFRLTYRLDT